MSASRIVTRSAAQPAFGVLALELSPGSSPAHAALAQAGAGELARLLSRDLARLVPEASELDLVLAAMHFDPAEVLRPGWPLHDHLLELGTRVPPADGSPRVIAFGADDAGNVPERLRADPELQGGALRVLPFLLNGAAETVEHVRYALETQLLDLGMAQADTALCAQEGFGAQIEHARYLTVHDLTAMMALQYTNLGLEHLWQVVETALLAPGRESLRDMPPEPLLHYIDGEVRMALYSPDTWRKRYADGEEDAARLERRFEMFQIRQRQYAAVLRVHGLDVNFVHCDGAEAP